VDPAAANDQTKLGRHQYKAVTNGQTNITSDRVLKAMGNLSYERASSFQRLWESLRAETWIVTAITTSFDRSQRETDKGILNQISSSSASTPLAEVYTPFERCLNRRLYHNALFSRLRFPHRYIAVIQIDVFGFKEVGTTKDFVSHTSSSMDIYGIIRLCKPIVKTEDVVTDTKISTSNSSGNLSSIASGVTSGKTQPDGSYVTSTRKITSVRSQEGMKFVEFPWREHAVFRFPLPEGQISLPTNYKLGKQYRPKLAGGKMPGFAERKLEDTDCVTPPKNLQISIFERTFFELQLEIV
jgi:hypothetical protein